MKLIKAYPKLVTKDCSHSSDYAIMETWLSKVFKPWWDLGERRDCSPFLASL